MDYEKLLEMADEAARSAYAPYSDFKVGAALLASSGKVFLGCNVENASYGASICAERAAVAKAVSEGEREYAAIAVSAGKSTAMPCGICRQVLAEFSPQLEVIVRKDGRAAVYKLSELLPHRFEL